MDSEPRSFLIREVIDWSNRSDIVSIANCNLWKTFSTEFKLDEEQVRSKAFGNSITSINKQLKHYGNRKVYAEKKESLLGGMFKMPYKKDVSSLQEDTDNLTILQEKCQLLEKIMLNWKKNLKT